MIANGIKCEVRDVATNFRIFFESRIERVKYKINLTFSIRNNLTLLYGRLESYCSLVPVNGFCIIYFDVGPIFILITLNYYLSE